MNECITRRQEVETAFKWIPRQCRNEHIDGVAISHARAVLDVFCQDVSLKAATDRLIHTRCRTALS
jgi:hypothetical protein